MDVTLSSSKKWCLGLSTLQLLGVGLLELVQWVDTALGNDAQVGAFMLPLVMLAVALIGIGILLTPIILIYCCRKQLWATAIISVVLSCLGFLCFLQKIPALKGEERTASGGQAYGNDARGPWHRGISSS